MMCWPKSNKIFNTGIALILLLTLGVSPGQSKVFDRVVAKVNEEIITLSGLQERLNAEIARYRNAGGQDNPPLDEMKEKLLDKMIDEKLQIQDGKELGMKVEEENILKALDDIKKANNINDDQLEDMLRHENTSIEQYKETIRNQIMVSKVVGFQVNNRTKISEKEMQSYYMKNRKDYVLAPKVKARHILFILNDVLTPEQRALKEQRAQEVKNKLDAGGSFEELAKKYSEDVSASSGGDLGLLERGKMVIDLENAIFALKAGETSDLIRTPYGIHIAKVDKVIPGGFKPFNEVKDEIEQKLRGEKFQKNYESYMRDLRKSAFIEKSLVQRPNPGKLSTRGKTRQSALGGKLPPLNIEPSPVDKSNKSRRPVRRKPKVSPNDILPPLTISKPQSERGRQEEARALTRKSRSKAGTFEEVQEELKKIKKLRDDQVISETEYQKQKSELLNNL